MSDIPGLIAAIGALGLAAYGLVDGSKALWGGPSHFGFGTIRKALKPFESALDGALGQGKWIGMLKSQWLAGRPSDEQKAIARSMIRLGLRPEAAADLAVAGHVDADDLKAAVEKLTSGKKLSDPDLNVLGRVDASVDMILDAAFERADAQYKNAARLLAGVIAVVIAICAEIAMDGASLTGIGKAVLIGLVAVPIAPMAKDLSTTFSAAARALAAAKG